MFSRIAQILCVFATLFGSAAASAQSAQLVMFEREDCPWCGVWHREIGIGYPHSDEGLRAPLRRVDLNRAWPADLPKLGIRYTPTFVLLACGREVGRITGYPGADFFYPYLDQLLTQLAEGEQATAGCS